MKSLSKQSEKSIARKFLIDFLLAFTVATLIVIGLAWIAGKAGDMWNDYKYANEKGK